METKTVTIWTAITTAILGTGGAGGYVAVDKVYEVLDERYVTIAAQNLETKWRIQDELTELDREINRRVQQGEDVNDLLVRKAVLQERLKQLERNQ